MSATRIGPLKGSKPRLTEAGVTRQRGGTPRLAFEAEGVECRFRIPPSPKRGGA